VTIVILESVTLHQKSALAIPDQQSALSDFRVAGVSRREMLRTARREMLRAASTTQPASRDTMPRAAKRSS